MEKLTFVSGKTAQLMQAAKLTDERGVLFQTKIMRVQREAGSAQQPDCIAKSVITAALFGFYSVPTPLDFCISLRDDVIVLVKAVRRGLFKKPTVTKEEILRRVEIHKDEIVGATVEQEGKVYKLGLQLSDGFTLVMDVTERIIPAVNMITKTLGYLDCWL